MMRVYSGAVLCSLAGACFAQSAPKELSHYTLFVDARSQLILGSEDSRSGFGFSLAVGREDPKLRIGNMKAELIWEGYFLQSSSDGVGSDLPNTSLGWGAIATARYRWQIRNDINIFADVGFGVQWINETSNDVPLAFNTTPSIGFGYEFKTKDNKAIILGTRILHVSNGGRQPPNPGQNYLQWYIGFKY
jgi:hypothetical protein